MTATDPAAFSNKDPSVVRRVFSSTTVIMVLVVAGMIALFTLITPNNVFFSSSNFSNLALSSAQLMLLSVGTAFILGAGELDLSIGSNVILSSVVGANVISSLGGTREQVLAGNYANVGLAVVAGLGACLLTGALFGVFNALIVNILKVNSFIATLATLSIGLGAAYVVTGGINVSSLPVELQENFGVAKIFGLPLVALIAIGVGLIFWFILSKLRFGLHTVAMGSSKRSAERAGINISQHRIKLFVMMGLISGFVGFLDLSRFLTTNIQGHTTDNLQAISAVVIGGTSLFGGVARVWGAAVASLIPAILTNGLVIMRIDSFYQLIAIGAILVIAVTIDQRRRAHSP